ncbi:MAG: pre-peptidase C-terminal domain-containing protein [Acidobacteria bacterium]|nr:pre-peptidase C-terminal domain-containing protein [Acidobacteriota bacterium]
MRTRVLTLVLCLSLLATVAVAQPQVGKEPADGPTGPSELTTILGPARPPMAPGGTVSPARPVQSLPGVAEAPTTGQSFVEEVEPNDTSATATPAGGTDVVVRGYVYGNGDVDYYSFTAAAGDRVYAATQTSFSASASTDSVLTLLGTDGTTTIEEDDNDGTLGASSSTIAGATIPSAGTYFLRVRHFSATSQLRPYHLHLKVQSGSPTAEVEPNDDVATAQALPAAGWISGSTSSATDVDFYSITLNAGDTVFLSLDLDPERDTTTWNGQVGLGVFNGFILVANDASVTSPNSEAFFMTVKDAGTYYAFVGVGAGTTFGTYHLSVGVRPAGATCTTTTSTDVPKTIPDGPGSVTSTLTLPPGTRIGSLAVLLDLTHANMPDLDITLTSPDGSIVGLLSDIGANTQTAMNLRLDDDAGIPIGAYTVVSGPVYQPELAYRLAWFNGMDAAGVWTLTVYDDTAANGGTLNSWGLVVCPEAAPAACTGGTPTTLFTNDFEAGDGGFTHAGTADEWERGLPTFAPITTCHSGTNCWKTDLDNTYNASSTQDLVSPPIVLSGPGTVPIRVSWAQKFQMESASFDHFWVEVRPAGSPAVGRKLYEWRDASMTNTVGNPTVTLQESAGWAVLSADISEYAGQTVELRFHLDTDTSVNYAGTAIDDVTVSSCGPVPVELAGFSVE